MTSWSFLRVPAVGRSRVSTGSSHSKSTLIAKAPDDGAAFQKLQAAYDRLLEHTKFDEQLEELDADLEAEEGLLDELEMKRFERELRENALADYRKQRERRQEEDEKDQREEARDARRDARRAERRREEDTQWLRDESDKYEQYWAKRNRRVAYWDLHVHRTRLVRDDKMDEYPPAVMLLWPNQQKQLCVHRREVQLHPSGKGSWLTDVWESEDKLVIIEQRTGPYNEAIWMMVEQKRDVKRGAWWCQHYWLRDSRYPFNEAEMGYKTYTWAHWADAPAGNVSQLTSRRVGRRELRRIRDKADADRKQAAKAAADKKAERIERDAEARLRADKEAEESKFEQRQAVREGLRKEAARVKEQKRHAAEVAEKNKQMAHARQLEYQDAEWQAFLQKLAEERTQKLAALKDSKGKQWEERYEEKKEQADSAKEVKRKRQEKEQERSRRARDKDQASKQQAAERQASDREQAKVAARQKDSAARPPPFEIGQRVTICHLVARPELNGTAGKVLAWHPDKEPPRFEVEIDIDMKETVLLKVSNLRRHTRHVVFSDEEVVSDADSSVKDVKSSASPDEGSAEEGVHVKVEEVEVDEAPTALQEEEEELRPKEEAAEPQAAEPQAAEPQAAEPEAATELEAAEEAASPIRLEIGRRIKVLWEDEEPPTWFEGCVERWTAKRGHFIRYDDGDTRWYKKLDEVQWERIDPDDAAPANMTLVAKREDDPVIAIPSEAQEGVRLTRSKRKGVKLAEEDVVDGLIQCPGCGLGLQMADGGCSVTTCRNAQKHGGRFFYFCAHCKAECPDGESMCTSCPSRNDRQTRKRVQARRKDFLARNSCDNPCEIDSD